MQDRLELARTIRELNNDLNQKRGETAEAKAKIKGLQEDNELLRTTLNEFIRSTKEIESDNERLKNLLESNLNQEDQLLEDRTLKMELDDAYTKLNLLEEQLDEERTKINHYQRELEQYQFKLEDMQLQLASRINVLPPPALGEEGVKQSYFMGSRIHHNTASRIGNSRQSEVEVFNLGASSMRPTKESVVVKQSRL